MPFKNITKAEVLAVLLRIYNQKKLDETRDPRWSDYYVQAKVLGVTQAAVSTMDQHATREVIALYMWRLHNAIDKERRTESKTSTSTVTSGGTNNLTNSLVSK